MKQTANDQLNQWESTDRILMEDFNNDNAKIGKALAAMAEVCPYVKIFEIGTETAAAKVNLDVSDIDFTQYYSIELFVMPPA